MRWLFVILVYVAPVFGDESKLERTRALIENKQVVEPVAPSGLKAITSLFVVLGVFGVFVLFMKKKKGTSNASPVLSRIRVSGRAEIVLVEVDGEKILVGLNGDGISLIPFKKS